MQMNYKAGPKQFIAVILHYRNACAKLRLTIQIIYHVLFLGQCFVNRPIVSKPPKRISELVFVNGSEWAMKFEFCWSCTLWDLIVVL